ncbi:hypothetical protein [Rubritalea sp.]|uniref:hypothetical protein n=1 Tax=Rubritalea sp. TaxID=2109375 RepID=UPI003EF85DF2
MLRVQMKMSWPARAILALIILTSWCSGLAFYIFNNFLEIEGEFGPEKHPLQYTILKIHGAAAFAMILTFGYLLASHIPIGLKAKRERLVGLTLTFIQLALIVSAYFLYYGDGDGELRSNILVEALAKLLPLSDEHKEIREETFTFLLHFYAGLCYPLFIILHIVLGKRNSNKRRAKRREQAEAGSIG